MQYSYLLSSQLESQRLYFEEKMAHIEAELTEQVQLKLCGSCAMINDVDGVVPLSAASGGNTLSKCSQ